MVKCLVRLPVPVALQHAVNSLAVGRIEQALSMLQMVLRGRQECLGPRHSEVLECQVRVGPDSYNAHHMPEPEACAGVRMHVLVL